MGYTLPYHFSLADGTTIGFNVLNVQDNQITVMLAEPQRYEKSTITMDYPLSGLSLQDTMEVAAFAALNLYRLCKGGYESKQGYTIYNNGVEKH